MSVEGEESIKRAISLRGSADCILLDTLDRATNRVGGTGKIHDWKISAQIAREAGMRIVLAGGLTPENVTQAVSLVKPWAVDVNSGIESEDGQKSAELMRRFIAAAKAVQYF